MSPYHQPKIAREFRPQIRADYPTKTFQQLAAEWKVTSNTIRKIVYSDDIGGAFPHRARYS